MSKKMLSEDALAKLDFLKEMPTNFDYSNSNLSADLLGLYPNVSKEGDVANRHIPALANDAACVETAMIELHTLVRKTRLPSTINVLKIKDDHIATHSEAHQAIVAAAKVLTDSLQRDFPAEFAAAERAVTRDVESRR